MTETKNISYPRLFSIVGVLAFIFIIFTIRLGYLQLMKGNIFKHRSERNQSRSIYITAHRSIIYDRNKELKLAYNQKSLALTVIKANLPEDTTEKKILFENIGRQLSLSVPQIEKIIKDSKADEYTPIVLKTDVSSETISYFAEKIEDYPGIYWENQPRRVYPFNEGSFHIIGYTGLIDQKEYKIVQDKPEYHLGGFIGKIGIEKQYDELIRGKYGILQRSVNARGQVLQQDISKDPAQDHHLVLTIDARLQAKAYELISPYKGAVVITKVDTGEVLTIVSAPSINPNIFHNISESSQEFYNLLLDPNHPFVNRAIQGKYPPASIFKLISSAAFLKSGIDPNKILTTTGSYDIGNRTFKDWKNHGKVDMKDAIGVSANVYFYHHSQIVGRNAIFDMARDFGITKPYQIDLPEEHSGFIPNESWFQKTHKRRWSHGDTANIAIGQGDMLTTPLELNMLTATIANGGTIYRPHILKERLRIRDKAVVWKQEKMPLKTVNLSPEYFKLIQEGMAKVLEPNKGTAGWLNRYKMISIPIGAKTGTAQTGLGRKDNGLFTAYGPYGQENLSNAIAITVLLERERTGTAVRITSELFNYYFTSLYPKLYKNKK
ncbi:MAG: penicillin-binding protein 2, partial [Brevinema sp.]